MPTTSLGFKVISWSGLNVMQFFLNNSLLPGSSLKVAGLLLLFIKGIVLDTSPVTDTIPKSSDPWSGSYNSKSIGIPSPVITTSIL